MAGRLVTKLVAGLAVLAAACGGSGGDRVESSAFVADLCTAITDWTGEIADRQASMLEALLDVEAGIDPDDPERAFDRVQGPLVEVLDAFADDTADLVDAIDEAGVPDVDDGEQLVADLKRIFENAESVFEDFRDRVEDLEASPTVGNELVEITDEIEEELEQVFEDFSELEDRYDSPSLDAAFDNEPACASID